MATNTTTILSYMSLAAQLIEAGQLTISKLRGFLVQEGATPAQLADLDARLSAAIDRRESEGHPI